MRRLDGSRSLYGEPLRGRYAHAMDDTVEARRIAYLEGYHRAIGANSAQMNALAGVPIVEELAVTVMFAFTEHRKHLKVPEGPRGTTLTRLVLKLSHELLAFVGSMKAGSLVGGYHHVRAIIELGAAHHYLFGNPALTDRRCERFLTWQLVEHEKHARRVRSWLAAGKCTQAHFEELMAEHASWGPAVDDEVLANWAALYEYPDVKKGKLPNTWHHPLSITKMIQSLDARTPGTADAEGQYVTACHATHVSPVGHYLADHKNMKIIGWDERQAQRAVVSLLKFAIGWLLALDDVLGESLFPAIQNVASQCAVQMTEKSKSLGLWDSERGAPT